MHRRIAPAAAALLAAGLLGCSDAPAPKAASASTRVVFPPPPAEAVVEWVASYSRPSDLGLGSSAFKKFLVGKEEREPGLVAPMSVAISPDGKTFYVVDQKLDAVVVLSRELKRFEVFQGDGAGRIGKPIGIAVGPDGSLYVADTAAQSVHAFDSALKFRASYGGRNALKRPTNLAVSSDGRRLAVCDTPADRVLVYSLPDGKLVKTLGTGTAGSKEGEFNSPYTVAYDDRGFLYVADYLNFRIQVFASDGEFVTAFGQAGDNPGAIARPRGLAVDSENGIVYEVDGAFQLVQMFNADGEYLMWFGSPGKGPGQFALPTGIARRGSTLAVADTMNGRIQLFRFLGAPKAPRPE